MPSSPITASFLALSLISSTGCDVSFGPDGDKDTSPSDVDDTGHQGDTDPDDTDEPTPCDPFDPDPVPGPDCISGTISCGDTITATTVGGSSVLEQDLYEASFCFVPWDSYTGAERVYAFDLRQDQVATFTLDSPCSDLDLVLMRWEDTSSCPTERSLISECDADVDPGDGTLTVWNNVAARYLIVVDGKDDAEDNFKLGVSCRQ